MIRPGEEWGSPAGEPADLEISGGDADLAHAIAAAPGALICFRPDPTSDLARAIGIPAGGVDDPAGNALPVDALHLADGSLASNLCVIGTAPDRVRWSSPAPELEVRVDDRPWFAGRATTVVVATGQFLRGADIVPRGHPGDGKVEVQVYELQRGERGQMRSRLATGAHVPHPRIRQRTAHRVEVRGAKPLPVEVDGVTRTPARELSIEVVPGAYRLLI
jgi:hypothetical protein